MSLSPNKVRQKQSCVHCGTAFVPANPQSDRFCCAGCAYVHDMITNEGLDRFYDLKGKETTPPVQGLAFEQRDYGWLRERVTQAEGDAHGKSARLVLGLEGATCAGCIWLIERLFAQQSGALQVLTDPVQGQLEMDWEPGSFDPVTFAETLQQFGYRLCPSKSARGEARDPLIGRVGLCAAFAMNGMAFTLPSYLGMPADFMFAGLFQMITALSATLAMAVGGSYFIRRAWQALQHGVLHVDVPIALGVSLAYVGSLIGWLAGAEAMLYFDFVAIFVFLMLGGRWVQEVAMRRNQRHLTEQDAVPSMVRVDGEPVALAELQQGQCYEIEPNQIVPVASRIESEAALLGMEWIQGESDTREEKRGGVAASGAIYRGQTPLRLEARETWAESLLQRLVKNEASRKEHPLLQQILKAYLWVVLAVGLLGGMAWWLSSGDAITGLQVTLSIFVISCPCALGVAIPLADEFAASAARRLGVFVQQLTFWPRLRRVRKLLFDKTGTLTMETPTLVNPEALEDLDADARQALATLAGSSSHPVSRSLTASLAAASIRPAGTSSIEELPGVGLRWVDPEGRRWALSRPREGLQADVEFTCNEVVKARLRFRDTLREGAAEEIEGMRRRGLVSHILSGDREGKVGPLARALGLEDDQWQARMTPDEKAERVAELDNQDTLYVGDGVNDSLAFDRAFATLTPAFDRNLLGEKADAYFVTRGLAFLTPLIRLAHTRSSVIRQVFTFAVIYNVVAIAICLTGHMNPLLAAFLMPISSVMTTGIVALGFRGAGTA